MPHNSYQPEDHELAEFDSVIKALQREGRRVHPPRALLTRILSNIPTEEKVSLRAWWGSLRVLVPAGIATLLLIFTATLVVTQTSPLRETMTRGDSEQTTQEEFVNPASSLRVTEDASGNEVAISVAAAPLGAATYRVYVFFPRNNADAEDCTTTLPLERRISAEATPKSALDTLLRGLTPTEQQQGFITLLPQATKVDSLSLVDGVAHVDFNSALTQHAESTCALNTIRAQIEQTLLQFPSVRGVVISVNGAGL